MHTSAWSIPFPFSATFSFGHLKYGCCNHLPNARWMWNSRRSYLFSRFHRRCSSFLHSPKVRLHSSPLHSRLAPNTFSANNTHDSFPTNSLKNVFCNEKPVEDTEIDGPVSSKSNLRIGRSVISGCSHLWEKKADGFLKNSSLQDILKQYGHLSPESTRRFWRVPALKPDDFLEILLGFGPDVVNLKKVEFLWMLFRWAGKQRREFSHVPNSVEIMAAMLIRARMLEDAEMLLLSDEVKGVFSGHSWVFSEIIRGCAEDSRLNSSIALYDRAREMGLALSGSCYTALIGLLTRLEKSDLAVRVYIDMLDVGLGSCSEDRFLEFVIRALSKKGRTLEAVNVLKKLKGFSVQPSAKSLTAVVEGYCRKKDYDDALIFLEEWNHVPEASVCNKIISSLCSNLGSEGAWMFVQRLETIGFELDALPFGIFISQSCSEQKLRDAFIYLSESYSRRVKLDGHAYNALISGLFKEGMFSSVKNIYEEMTDLGLIPGLSTFKILLAGYCKHRKFDEVKQVLGEMINCGLTSLSCGEDALSKAFQILGLNYLRVKVKRDNDLGCAKAEFFDSLGNGLYLETNVEEYDKVLDEILANEIFPDFDSLIMKECYVGDMETALRTKGEAVQWGKNISLTACSKLMECLCASPSHLHGVIGILDETPEVLDEFGSETLNLLIQYLSNNGVVNRARSILDRSFKRQITIESDTYASLLLGFRKENSIEGFRECLQVAQRSTWSPRSTDLKELISFLCKFGLIKDTLELFESAIEMYRSLDLISVTCGVVLEELCSKGFTDVGYILLEEFLQRGHAASVAFYATLIEGFVKEQKFTKAVRITDQLLEKNITLSTCIYQLVVPLLFKFDRARQAMSLKQNVLNLQCEDAIIVYNTLVNELCKIGKTKEAASQLHEMLRNKVFPDDITLNALIQGYCHIKSLRKVLQILCFMLRNDIDLSIPAYRSLIRQYCAHGQLHGALNLQKLMQVNGESCLFILHNILLFYLFQSGNSLPAKAFVKKMLEKHLALNPFTYDILVYGSYKCGDASRSVRLLKTMIARGMKPNDRSLRTVICHLCRNGKFNEAMQLSKVMECRGWKHGSVILYVLTERLLQCGGNSMAESFLDRMEENDLIPDTANLDVLIKRFCVHGYMEKAVDLLNVMLKKGSFPSETSYSLVMEGLSIRKLFDRALDFLAEMRCKTLEPSLDSCNALVCGLCDNGRTDDARKVLGEMLRFGPVPSEHIYNYVINKYYAQNDLNKASELLQEMQLVGYSPHFETHWSLISNLSCHDKEEDDPGKGFLSRLLSGNDLPAIKDGLPEVK